MVVGILATLTAAVTFAYNAADRRSAAAADARSARAVILADAIRMVEYDEADA